jgi:hypothetical protein
MPSDGLGMGRDRFPGQDASCAARIHELDYTRSKMFSSQ